MSSTNTYIKILKRNKSINVDRCLICKENIIKTLIHRSNYGYTLIEGRLALRITEQEVLIIVTKKILRDGQD